MFKKFDSKDDIANSTVAKSSVVRSMRAKIVDQYEHIEDYMDQILPKKDPLKIVKCHEHIELYCNPAGEILFFKQRDGPYMPSLKLLHKYPFILPHMQVDKGAIRFVLSGANIMCPGLTSPGARMTNVEKDTVVAVMAEGKQHALAIGYTKLSAADIQAKNKGIGVDNIHFLNDGLWIMKPIK